MQHNLCPVNTAYTLKKGVEEVVTTKCQVLYRALHGIYAVKILVLLVWGGGACGTAAFPHMPKKGKRQKNLKRDSRETIIVSRECYRKLHEVAILSRRHEVQNHKCYLFHLLQRLHRVTVHINIQLHSRWLSFTQFSWSKS